MSHQASEYFGQEHADYTLQEDDEVYRNNDYDGEVSHYESFTDDDSHEEFQALEYDNYGQISAEFADTEAEWIFDENDTNRVDPLPTNNELDFDWRAEEASIEYDLSDQGYLEDGYDHFEDEYVEVENESIQIDGYDQHFIDQLIQEEGEVLDYKQEDPNEFLLDYNQDQASSNDWDDKSFWDGLPVQNSAANNHQVSSGETELLEQDIQSFQTPSDHEHISEPQRQSLENQLAMQQDYLRHLEYEQHRLQSRNKGDRNKDGRGRRQRGHDHFTDQKSYSLRDHIPGMRNYRHDMSNGKNRITREPEVTHRFPNLRSSDLNQSPGRIGPHLLTQPLHYAASAIGGSVNLGSQLANRAIDSIKFPVESLLEKIDHSISNMIDKGLSIVSAPFRYAASRSANAIKQRYLDSTAKARAEKTNSNILDLYTQGFSKFEISDQLGFPVDKVGEVFDKHYETMFNTNSDRSPIFPSHSPVMMIETKNGENQEDRSNTSLKLEDPETITDPSITQDEEELSQDELIAKIIYLLNQNLTLSQIAAILKLEINFLFNLSKSLNQHHMHKLQGKYELELAIPSVKPILDQYSKIINDNVIRELPKNQILSMEYLREKTGLSDQQLRNLYRTELLLQMNQLLLQDYTPRQVGALVGYAPENVAKIENWYNLPNVNFSVYDLETPINAKLLAEELDLTARRVYDIFKFELLGELNDKLVAGLDMKLAANEIGVTYDKVRKWVNQYNLPNTVSYKGFTQPEEKYDYEWTLEEPGKIEEDEGTYLRSVQVGGDVGIIREDGKVMLAKELLGLTAEELQALGKFVMYNDNFQQVLSHIESVQEVEVEGVYRVQSTDRNYVILGPESRLIADDQQGLQKLLVNELAEQSVLVAKSLENLSSYMPTFFDLFHGLEVPLRMMMTEDATDQIKIRLRKNYGSSKGGCKALDIKYRDFIDHKYLLHEDLVNLYNTFSFPDIKSADFLKNVERIGIKGKKALIDNPLVTPDLFYLCGLIASDGYTLDQIMDRKSTTGFNNKVLELVDHYIGILRSIFPERHVALRQPRPPEQVTFEAVTYNFALVRIINNMTAKGIDVNAINAYLNILRLPLESVGAFVRGMMDGDGTVDLTAQRLSIGIFDELRAKNFQQLLRRLGIDHSVQYSEKWTTPPRAKEPIWSQKWDVRISGKLDILRYDKVVGSKHPDKIEKLRSLVTQLESQNSLTTQSRLAPRISGEYIKNLRTEAGLTQKQLDKIVGRINFTDELETGRNRSSVNNVKKTIDYFQSNELTKDNTDLHELRKIISSSYLLKGPTIEQAQANTSIVNIKTRNSLVVDNGLIVDGDDLKTD